MEHAHTNRARRAFAWELAAIGVAVAAVLVRCTPWRTVFSAQGRVALGVDPYYHLRRAQLLIETGGGDFDPFLSYPGGGPVPWPLGFDALVALPGLLGATWSATEAWALLLPTLLGGLGVYLCYHLGRAIWDSPSGLAAAVFCALMGGSIEIGLLGRVDHHALVAPVTLGLYLSVVKALQATGSRHALVWSLSAAALATYAAASWVITPPIYLLPVVVSLILLRWSRHRQSARRVSLFTFGASLMAWAIVLPLMTDLERAAWALDRPSLLLLLAYALLALTTMAVFIAGTGRWLLLAIAAVAALVGVATQPAIADALGQALSIAAGHDATYLMPLESRSPLLREDQFSLAPLAEAYTYLAILAPLLWFGAIHTTRRQPEAPPGRGLLLVYLPLAFALLLLQKRFGEFAAPALSLLFGWTVVQGGRWVGQAMQGVASRGRRVLWSVLLAGSAAAALSPLLIAPYRIANHDYTAPHRALLAFAPILRQHTAEPTDGSGRPAYGVLSGWLDAHPLLYMTGRAVAASSLGTSEARASTRRAFRLLLAANGQAAAERMRALGLRYALVSPISGQVGPMAAIAGIDPDLFEQTTATDDATRFRYTQAFFATVHSRLLIGDATAKPFGALALAPLPQFRLVAESNSQTVLFDQTLPALKLFEVVAGARIAGRTEAGSEVRLELALRTNTGRELSFVNATVADREGAYLLLAPYPTEPADSPTRALGPYILSTAGGVQEVRVREHDIQTGGRIELDAPGSRPASGPSTEPSERR